MAIQEYTGPVFDKPPTLSEVKEYTGPVFDTNPKASDYMGTEEQYKATGQQWHGSAIPGFNPQAPGEPVERDWKESETFAPQGSLPSMIEKGVRQAVSQPKEFLGGVAKPIEEGLQRAGEGFVETGAMVAEGLTGNIPYSPTKGLADRIRQSQQLARETDPDIKNYSEDDFNWAQRVLKDTTQMLPGMVVGGGMGKKLFDAGRNYVLHATGRGAGILGKPHILTRASRILTIGAFADVFGALTTMDPDEAKLLVGEDSQFKWLKGWGVNEDGTMNEKVWAQKANLALDSLITGFGVAGAFGAAENILKVFPGGLVRGLKTLLHQPTRDKQVAARFFELVANIQPSDSAEVILKKQQAAVNFIEANKDFIVDLDIIEEGLGQVTGQRSTFDLFIERAEQIARSEKNPERQSQLLTEIQDLRKSVVSHAQGATQQAINRPSQIGKEVVERIQEDYSGGLGAIEKGGREAVEGVEKRFIDPYETTIDAAQSQLDDLPNQLVKQLQTDSGLSKIVDKYIDLSDPVRGQQDQLAQRIIQIGKDISQDASDRFKAIPKGIEGDLEIIETAMLNIRRPESVPQWKVLKGYIDEAGGDFKELQDIARFDIEPRIKQLYEAGDKKTAEDLIVLKRALTDDQVTSLKNRVTKAKKGKKAHVANQKAVDSALDAINFYNENVVPWTQNPITRDILKMTRGKADDAMIPFRESSIRMKEGLLDPERGDYVGNLVDQIKKYSGEPGVQDVREFANLQLYKMLQSVADSKTALDPKDITNLADFIRNRNDLFGEDRVTELTKLFNEVKETGMVRKELLEKGIKNATKDFERMKIKIYGNVLKDFGPIREVGLPNTLNGFKNFFKSQENEGALRVVLSTAQKQGRDDVIKAVKGAYALALRDMKTFKKGGKANLDRLINPTDSLSRYAQILYGEDVYNSVFKKLGDATKQMHRYTGISGESLLDAASPGAEGRAAAQGTITMLFGILNPTAARIRIIMNQYIDPKTMRRDVENVVDTILANPDSFLEIAREIQKDTKKAFDPYVRQLAKRALEKGGLYAIEPESNDESIMMDMENSSVKFHDEYEPDFDSVEGMMSAVGNVNFDLKDKPQSENVSVQELPKAIQKDLDFVTHNDPNQLKPSEQIEYMEAQRRLNVHLRNNTDMEELRKFDERRRGSSGSLNDIYEDFLGSKLKNNQERIDAAHSDARRID